MAGLKIGFLPLYLQFYREAVPACTAPAEAFAAEIGSVLQGRGMEVVAAPVACRAAEIAAAVADFEAQQVDAVVTLHLAYSPSLEAADALAGTGLPLILLDTTPDFAYLPDHSTLMANHGIHGVQDLTNVLRRRGKNYRIVAGYHGDPVFYRRLEWEIRAAHSARVLRTSRVGLIGGAFDGMGDFAVSHETLRRELGVEVVDYLPPPPPKESAVRALAAEWFGNAGNDAVHRAAAAAALTVRSFLAEHRLNAFSFNFQELAALKFPGVPFWEASAGMARGVGYAGEGDVLTAAFVGALLASRPETTFTEMFCPDWAKSLVYLSHMGEVNHALLDRLTPAADPNPFIPLPTPVIGCGALKAGRCMLANLAPAPGDRFELIVAAGEMVTPAAPDTHRVSGYFRSDLPLPEMLRCYSENGGTHHLAAVYDTPEAFFRALAAIMNWNMTMIGGDLDK